MRQTNEGSDNLPDFRVSCVSKPANVAGGRNSSTSAPRLHKDDVVCALTDPTCGPTVFTVLLGTSLQKPAEVEREASVMHELS